MKKKLLSLSTIVVALFAGTQSVSAKEDVTSTYLTNAGLSSLDGWTIDKGFSENGYTAHKTDGDVPVIEFYHTWNANAGAAIGSTKTFDFSQKAILPAGYYRLKVNAFYREGNGNGTNTKAFIYSTSKTDGTYDYQKNVVGLPSSGVSAYTGTSDLYKAANAFSKGDFANEFDFDVTEDNTTMTIGFHGYIDTYCSWCILGPVTLYKYEISDFTEDFNVKVNAARELYSKPMNAAILETLKEKAEVDQTKWTTKQQITDAETALDNAIAAANTSKAIYAAIAEKYNTLDEAGKTAFESTENGAKYVAKTLTDEDCTVDFQKAAKAQTTNGADMTLAIVNPTIDGAEGWTTERPKGGNGPLLNGTSFEYWAGNASSRDEASFDYYQVITELPSGKYRIEADMYNSLNDEKDATFNESCGVYGNSEISYVTVDGTELKNYSVVVPVTKGTLRLGVKSDKRMGARWFVADNFKLTYVQPIALEDYYSNISSLLVEAAKNETKGYQSHATADALSAAITETVGYGAETNRETLQKYIDHLTAAVENSKVSVAAYASLNTVISNGYFIDRSEAFSDSPNRDFTYLAEAKKMYNDATTASADVQAKADGMLNAYRSYVKNIADGYIAVDGVKDVRENSAWEYTTNPKNNKTFNNPGNMDIEGDKMWENWNGSGLAVGDMKQTVKNIPNGKYFLRLVSFTRKSINENDYIYIKSGDKMETSVSLGESTKPNAFVNITNPIEVTNGEVEIGLHVGSGADWAAIGGVVLYAMDYTRHTAAGKAGTICLPYEFSVAGAHVYSAEIEGDKVILNGVTATKAGVPYIYVATANTQSFTKKNAKVVDEPIVAAPLVGTFKETNCDDNSYVLQTKNGVQGFYKADATIKVPAYKAFISTSNNIDPDPAKFSIVFEDETTTAINAVNALIEGTTKIYDINGRELPSLQKGVNIVNGVKVVVK